MGVDHCIGSATQVRGYCKEHPAAARLESKEAFGGKSIPDEKEFHGQWGQDWCGKHLDLENYLFHAHAQILMEGGIAKNRVTQLPMQKGIGTSHDLLRQAKKHHCGTIVMGRRGREAGKGFFSGRVSDKTMQHAQELLYGWWVRFKEGGFEALDFYFVVITKFLL